VEPARREAVFGGRSWDAAVVDRNSVPDLLAGPAIVDEQTATTVVPPGWILQAGETGVLLLRRDA
jgi:N-methylhydantoinase A